MTWEPSHIVIPVARPARSVAEFAGNPRNLPIWAGWSGHGVYQRQGRWYLDSGHGWAEVVFRGPLWAGVLDHEVAFPGEPRIRIPMRVIADGEGSRIIYTAFRPPTVPPDVFRTQVAGVTANLETLRRALES